MKNSVFFDKIIFIIIGPLFSQTLKRNFSDIYYQNKEFYDQICNNKPTSGQ